MIRVQRVYESPTPKDGYRLLVDRLWPRGLSKERARLDAWMRDVAPTADLRRWFGHDPARWLEFKERYAEELDRNLDLVQEILLIAHQGSVTLLYSARDCKHNQAVALAEYLKATALRGKG